MSREIRFRGYNLKNKKWLYGYYLVNRGKHFIAEEGLQPPGMTWEDFEVDPESVGQKVGEVGGVELYEGDVVNVYRKKVLFFRGKIMWDSVYCKYTLRTGTYGGHLLSTAKNLFDYEVTGNEYERKNASFYENAEKEALKLKNESEIEGLLYGVRELKIKDK